MSSAFHEPGFLHRLRRRLYPPGMLARYDARLYDRWLHRADAPQPWTAGAWPAYSPRPAPRPQRPARSPHATNVRTFILPHGHDLARLTDDQLEEAMRGAAFVAEKLSHHDPVTAQDLEVLVDIVDLVDDIRAERDRRSAEPPRLVGRRVGYRPNPSASSTMRVPTVLAPGASMGALRRSLLDSMAVPPAMVARPDPFRVASRDASLHVEHDRSRLLRAYRRGSTVVGMAAGSALVIHEGLAAYPRPFLLTAGAGLIAAPVLARLDRRP